MYGNEIAMIASPISSTQQTETRKTQRAFQQCEMSLLSFVKTGKQSPLSNGMNSSACGIA